MKLSQVEIKNFRSIKDASVDFDPPCKVLVGINESGKSNILKALALMDEETGIDKINDQREALPDEDPIDMSFVRFIFTFEKEESDQLFKNLSQKIAFLTQNTPIVSLKGADLSLKTFSERHQRSIYAVNILKLEKSFRYYTLGKDYVLAPGWKKPSSACPADFSTEVAGQAFTLSNYTLVKEDDFTDIPPEFLEDATINDLGELLGSCIISITKDNFPKTILWAYEEKMILPNAVTISDFAANPDTCLPLKHMFSLAGITEIGTELTKKKQEATNNQFQNYLDSVAKKTTAHFKSVWKEYKSIEFSLRLNGDKIIPGIKEKNVHDLARRSDGFKRFVTFLLMISVNVKTKNIRNTLILIDEPEIGLHPSGARFLRDELMRISKNNYVMYSTHSIFMIDSGDVSRHYLIEKKNEITSLKIAEESNVADEEVLYNALGYSVFEILKPRNIIFEGWKDKHLFQTFIEQAPSEIKDTFSDVGVCHAKGVKSIRAITPMIELANRGCLVISDSDAPAKELQKLYRQEKGYGTWKTYQDIDPSVEAKTGEDFLKNEFIVDRVQETLSSLSLPDFDASILPDKKDKLAAISGWLKVNGINNEQANEKLNEIKNSLFENLTYQSIDDTEYTKLIQAITF